MTPAGRTYDASGEHYEASGEVRFNEVGYLSVFWEESQLRHFPAIYDSVCCAWGPNGARAEDHQPAPRLPPSCWQIVDPM